MIFPLELGLEKVSKKILRKIIVSNVSAEFFKEKFLLFKEKFLIDIRSKFKLFLIGK